MANCREGRGRRAGLQSTRWRLAYGPQKKVTQLSFNAEMRSGRVTQGLPRVRDEGMVIGQFQSLIVTQKDIYLSKASSLKKPSQFLLVGKESAKTEFPTQESG